MSAEEIDALGIAIGGVLLMGGLAVGLVLMLADIPATGTAKACYDARDALTPEQWEAFGKLLCKSRDLRLQVDDGAAPGSKDVTITFLYLDDIFAALDDLREVPCWYDD